PRAYRVHDVPARPPASRSTAPATPRDTAARHAPARRDPSTLRHDPTAARSPHDRTNRAAAESRETFRRLDPRARRRPHTSACTAYAVHIDEGKRKTASPPPAPQSTSPQSPH